MSVSPDELTTEDPKPLISSVTAAARFGVTNDYITQLCRRKAINGSVIGRVWHIEPASLEKYLTQVRADNVAKRTARTEQLKRKYRLKNQTTRSNENKRDEILRYQAIISSAPPPPPAPAPKFVWSSGHRALAFSAVLAFATCSTVFATEGHLPLGPEFVKARHYVQTTLRNAEVGQQSQVAALSLAPVQNFFCEKLYVFCPDREWAEETGQFVQEVLPTPTPVAEVPPAPAATNITPAASLQAVTSTHPVVERVVETRTVSGLSVTTLVAILNEVSKDIRNDFYDVVGRSVGGSVENISTGLTLTDLTDANIPDTLTVSGYLPLAGGTLTGAITNSAGATSTFSGPLAASVLNISTTTATSTFANGIDLSDGCFAIDGTCLDTSGGGGSLAFDYLFPSNATTTGLGLYASTTIGAGGQGTGLTVSGGATTTGNLVVSGGKIGIGTPAAGFNAPLSFGASLGDNIYFYDAGVGSSYGIGVQNLKYRFFTDGSGADIQFGHGGRSTEGSFTPNVTFRGNGFSGFGTSTPYSKITAWGTGSLFEAVTNASTTVFSIGQTGATSTALAITNVTSSLLKTDSSGNVLAAVAGTDYVIGSQLFAFPWTQTTFGSTNANATSTLIGFNAGLYSLASSTIGNSLQAGGLTISGGATTTGNQYIAGAVGIGTQPTGYGLTVSGAGHFGDAFDATEYGQLQVARPSNQGDNAFHLSFIRNGAKVAGMGFLNNSSTFAIQNADDNSGSGGIFLDTSNNVGVGTTTPYSTLTAWGSGRIFETVNNASSSVFYVGQSGATTTALAISTLTSTLLKTDGSGNVIPAVAGTDYVVGSSFFAYPFPSNATSTTLTFNDGLVSVGSTTINGNLVVTGNSTTTNATTTNLNISGTLDLDQITSALVLTGAGGVVAEYTGTSCTNQFVRSLDVLGAATCATITSADVDSSVATFAYPFPSNATSTTLTFSGGLLSTSSSTIVALSTITSTSTSATTTNFAITGLASTLLKTNSDGSLLAAVAGTDYIAGSSFFAYPFPSNSTSTLLSFTGGLTSYASTTIGDGTAAGGLTISGNATTTGSVSLAGGNLLVTTSGFGTTTLFGLTISGSATSTSDVGWNITTGCYAVNNTCVGGGSSITGTTGQLAYFSATDTQTATSTLTLSAAGNFGIGSTTPWAQLAVHRLSTDTNYSKPLFALASSTASATTTLFQVDNTGLTTIGDPGGTGDANVQFAADANAWSLGYYSTDKSFRIASSTNLAANVALTIAKTTSAVKIGIGTTTPVSTLSVQGSLCVRDTGSCGTTAGTIYATTATISDIDLAENYTAKDKTLAAGEIVALDTATTSTIRRARPGDVPLGIISTKPGLLLGQSIKDGKPVALKGRVPLKVNLEGGEIEVGDPLTLSSVPGVGTKATTTAWIVGIALEPYSEELLNASSTIEVFVQSEFRFDGESIDALMSLAAIANDTSTATSSEAGGAGESFVDKFMDATFNRLVQWFADAANGITDFFANRIRTKELCVDDVCVTREQFAEVFGSSQSAAPSSGDNGEDDENNENDEEESNSEETDDDNATSTPSQEEQEESEPVSPDPSEIDESSHGAGEPAAEEVEPEAEAPEEETPAEPEPDPAPATPAADQQQESPEV